MLGCKRAKVVQWAWGRTTSCPYPLVLENMDRRTKETLKCGNERGSWRPGPRPPRVRKAHHFGPPYHRGAQKQHREGWGGLAGCSEMEWRRRGQRWPRIRAGHRPSQLPTRWVDPSPSRHHPFQSCHHPTWVLSTGRY